MKLKGRLFLIDGSSFCYRAFYAIKSLSTSKGQPTNAVYGVITMLKKLIEAEKPEYLGVAFDLPKPTFRHVLYEGYKEHRRPMPEALVSQMSLIRDVFRAFRVPIFEREGYEADDLLGTIALKAAEEGLEVFIVTGDKDILQLLGPKIKVYRPTRDGHEIVDEEALYQKWCLKPGQVVEVMALMGDDTDAIPGVPGIGEKIAVELIKKFGSVKSLMERLPEIPGEARRSAIEKNREQMLMSYELAKLDTDVPVDLDFSRLQMTQSDTESLRHIFQELEFRTLLKELSPLEGNSSVQVRRIGSEKEALDLLGAVRLAGRCSVVFSLSGSLPMRAEILGVGISWGAGNAAVVPAEFSLGALAELWQDSSVVKICPGLKDALVFFLKQRRSLAGPWADPLLASYLLDPARSSHSVAVLAQEFLGEAVGSEDPLQSAALEAEAAFRLMPEMEKQIAERSLLTLLDEVEVPLAEVLAEMEVTGICVDLKEIESLAKEVDRMLTLLTQEVYAFAGGESFNINSPKQLAQVLFERLKLPVIKKTKTGASTDEEVLRRLSLSHPLPAKILEYREIHKLSSTYVEALPKLVHPETGRIHTSLNQTVTATGRLSSSNPNLQNIPIRTEIGRQIRRAFVPCGENRVFLAADYSQIELRIMAHLSQDDRLVSAFRGGEDIHRITAAEIFHVKPEEVTPAQRSAAKTINFGIVYGMTAFGLSKELGIGPAESDGFIRRYFERYPGVKDYLQRSLEDSREKGYCTTIFHRRRYIPEIKSKDPVVRQFAERTAINAPIQGSAADLIKVAMVGLSRTMKSGNVASKMILQVHDELIFDVPDEELGAMKSLVKETMESPVLSGKKIKLSVPVEVKLKVGRSWFETSQG